ncbi:polysaccharide pyruvyl transferase family protein [Streptomyces sp. DSM 15324]|uniref:polysaccharide pyruvyl transferase family protein n=1 Tax=Streptomyces sp. DSM 15324 TaxID=1739111 RepID=UPI000748B1D4|nr:polysaccharide pyruvyl transferase family protein [Streptomyces sp. DSM 15324]KUO13932.1 polysaccharide pyruvyl transferase [Streptomyces sp. DSM 15324]
MKRILLRSGKSPFDVVPVEEALHRDVFATNSGNLIFSDATHKILSVPGSTEVVSNGIATQVSAAGRINEEYDAFVVPLANAFRPTFEGPLKRLTQLISKLKIPVVVVGVGAQAGLDNDPARLKSMESTVREFVSAVLDHSASIGVRGEFTAKYLTDLGFKDVEIIGCPSLFLHGERLEVTKRAAAITPESRISTNGSHTAVRAGLGRIIGRAHANYPHLRYIGQNLTDARQLHWRDTDSPAGRIREMPTHPDHPMYREDKVRVYIDPVTWIDDLKEFDYSFGSRIHGNIAALLAGTPATVLAFDSRTLELCRYFEIPHRLLSEVPADLDPAELYEEADFSALTGNHQERFDRFTAFLDKNGLENTFTHGDGGKAFDERLRALRFPEGVRPWIDADPASLTSRFGWLQQRITELDTHNTQLQRELAKSRAGAKAAAKAAAKAVPTPSMYRRARRVMGRALKPSK